MKKFFALALCVLLLLPVTSVVVSAIEFLGDSEPTIAGDVIFEGGACDNGAEPVAGTGAIYNFEGGTAYCCKFDAYVQYAFKAPSDGTYTVKLSVIGRTGSNRAFDVSIDNSERIFVDIEENDAEQWVTVDIDMTAGDHTLQVYAPTGMDDSALKSVDVYSVALYLTKPKVAEPEPVAEKSEAPAETASIEIAPAETVPEQTPAAATAPQTFDLSIVFLTTAAISAAGVVVVKKRK